MKPRSSTIVLCGALALAAGGAPPTIRDVSGQLLTPFKPAGRANVLFFVSSDCPVSNSYAPEIQRLCDRYRASGVACSLMYEDLQLDAAAVRKHLDDYRYRGIPAAVDGSRTIADHTRASVTPQAVLVDAAGAIRYSGRIDNFYAALGKPRQRVTVHDLSDAVDAVLAGKPVMTPQTQALGCAIVPADLLRK